MNLLFFTLRDCLIVKNGAKAGLELESNDLFI